MINVDRIFTYMYCKSKVKLVTLVEGDLMKNGFSLVIMLNFPGLLHFTLDPYLTTLSVKLGGMRYHSLNLWK